MYYQTEIKQRIQFWFLLGGIFLLIGLPHLKADYSKHYFCGYLCLSRCSIFFYFELYELCLLACVSNRFIKENVLSGVVWTCITLCKRNHWSGILETIQSQSASQSSKTQLPFWRMHIILFRSWKLIFF